MVVCLVLALGDSSVAQEPTIRGPYEIKFEDDQPAASEPAAAVDPEPHAQVGNQGNMYLNIRVDNQPLHLGIIQTLFNIDGSVLLPGSPPGMLTNELLKASKGKKIGVGTATVYHLGKLAIRQEVLIVPTRAKPGQSRRLDSVMVRYLIDNADNQAHKVGLRITVRPVIQGKRAPLFAVPNQPNKVLNGVELTGNRVPDFLQILQRSDLKDPGFVAHMTYNLGRGYARPDRVVLTGRTALARQWAMQVIPSKTYSVVGVYWEPKEIAAGARRNLAYAFGEGIASGSDGEGQVRLVLGGAFEPGKLFTVSAYIHDPAAGQHLTLELPPGMERLEGKERQPVPAVDAAGNSLVLWKARVLKTGRFPLRVHSSTGVTYTRVISVRRR